MRNAEQASTAWSAVITEMLRRLVVLLQHERRDIKYNVLRVLLNFSNDRMRCYLYLSTYAYYA